MLAGVAAGAATAAGVGLGPEGDGWRADVRGLIVSSYVLAGVYTWWRRPGSRLGLLLVAVGLVYAIASLAPSADAVTHTIGRATHAGFIVYLAAVFLCFPHDRLGTPRERRLVAALAILTALLWLAALSLLEKLPPGGPLTHCGPDCPDNALRLVSAPGGVEAAIRTAVSFVTAAALLGVALVLVGKARSPARLQRRLIVPLLGAVIVLAVNYAAFTLLRQAGVDDLGGMEVLGAASALAIPAAAMVGQVRGRAFAATSVGRLVSQIDRRPLTPARIEEFLREALGDPLLTLALGQGGGTGFVDVEGRPIELPTDRPGLAVTTVRRSGVPVAAVVHDAALKDDSDITDGLAATALVLLENAQLVGELQASRARLVLAAQQERLRLERDLHDSAQQRLFGLQVKLAAAQARADGGFAAELDELAAEAAAAAAELRDVAHGLYPPVLRERGLVDGLRSAARSAAIPVRVEARDVGRAPPTVEEAVYFCVLEAIQNAAKHAGPDVYVAVSLERRGADLEFTVVDDGHGFPPHEGGDGIGLLTMRDRVGAVGGRLDVVSQPGEGTAVRGLIAGCWPVDP